MFGVPTKAWYYIVNIVTERTRENELEIVNTIVIVNMVTRRGLKYYYCS